MIPKRLRSNSASWRRCDWVSQPERTVTWADSAGKPELTSQTCWSWTSTTWCSAAQTDINPAALIVKGIFLDHATGLVVGETAVIGDTGQMLQNVTLGGTGKEGGDRHPKIDNGVLIGAGAKILGNIHIGYCSRFAAGSVVLTDMPPKSTVAGVPAKVGGEAGCSEPSRAMDQILHGAGFDI